MKTVREYNVKRFVERRVIDGWCKSGDEWNGQSVKDFDDRMGLRVYSRDWVVHIETMLCASARGDTLPPPPAS